MAQPYPYLDESVRLVTPLSGPTQNYDSVTNQSPYFGPQSLNQSPNDSMIVKLFRMSSRYDLWHQPRQYFCYISVICMLYCVVYRLFFYYTLYQQYRENSVAYYAIISWVSTLNGFVSGLCLCILLFITVLITLIRIHNQCSPENIQILLFSVLRLCVMFILNIIIVIFADSFILFTFISYVFNPSSSSNSNHVDIFWQSIRKYLKDAEAEEKMKRLITIHYYCMNIYIKQTKRYNTKDFNQGIFGRKQQQIAIQRLKPIVYNEYNQKAVSDMNLDRFGISTPQSLSSYHRRNFMKNLEPSNALQHHDLQIWFSVVLWMPIFINDKRYSWYWIIEKVLLRISLIAVLSMIIYTETKCAITLIPIYTAIRCVLEVINILNLIPFVVFDDPDFDNIAELYSSRELSYSISKRKRSNIVNQINKTYHNYCRNIYNNNNNNNNPLYQSKNAIRIVQSHSIDKGYSFEKQVSLDAISPAPTPHFEANNIKKYDEDEDVSTDFEEEIDDNEFM